MRPSADLVVGGAIVSAYALAALAAPLIAPYDPLAVDPPAAYLSPNAQHLFGTDRFGLDVFSRVIYAARLDLLIVATSTAMAAVVGIPLGILAGYRRGKVEWTMLRVLDMVQSFPALILAMAVVAALGQQTVNVILVASLIAVPYYARLTRAEALVRRSTAFVEAAQMIGCSRRRVIFRHLLPNCIDSSLAYAAVNAAWALLIAAGLGFLGLGVRVPTPEWGLMVSMGTANVVTGEWWVSFFPGLAIVGLTLGLYLLADGLRDALDPRSGQ